ncbi:hypothetical protein [Bifidobacterium vansinderenii]|uniref:Uncharacterized protein n=1 Tax=Bifidobacterium vansinderenii TaxID=1984871 RepID=A0A229VYC2_9BIFI|nr:hypothetical protein [Bifidobacterium vansinderenii]OXN00623.1 hypothetical protein Tam10B_1146 [Bifidobacterium vansinderenii]
MNLNDLIANLATATFLATVITGPFLIDMVITHHDGDNRQHLS